MRAADPLALHESGPAVYNLSSHGPGPHRRAARNHLSADPALRARFGNGPNRPRAPRLFICEEASSLEESAFLTPALLQNISIYIDVLLRWNARINLTAVRDREEIVTRHFGESLFAARHLFPDPRVPFPGPGKEMGRVRPPSEPLPQAAAFGPGDGPPTDLIDLGSGAGFPGLPIKMWAPGIRATLIESSQKKATFLREAIRALRLTDINVFSGRGENFAGQARVVTLRAVERFDIRPPCGSQPGCPLWLSGATGRRRPGRARPPAPPGTRLAAIRFRFPFRRTARFCSEAKARDLGISGDSIVQLPRSNQDAHVPRQ